MKPIIRLALCSAMLLYGCNKVAILEHAPPVFTPSFSEEHIPVGNVQEVHLANGMTVYMDEDSTYFLGDMLFSKAQIDAYNSETKSTYIKDASRYWPSNIIPYHIRSGFTQNDINEIREGLTMLEDAIDFDFIECTTSQSDGINFTPAAENSSFIGKQEGGNRINLHPTKFIPGIVAHEVMHSLGFFHEQARTYRDSYVTIHWDNIESGKEHNFETFVERGLQGYNDGPYDYRSIMHYDSYEFTKVEGLPTITKKDGSIIKANREALTSGDIKGLYMLYGLTPSLSVRAIGGYDETSEQTRDSYEEYENWVFFEDRQGNPQSLEYPKLLIVRYYCRVMEQSEYNTSVTNRVDYILVPAGASKYQLPNTERASYEEMGIPRYQKDEYYTVIR